MPAIGSLRCLTFRLNQQKNATYPFEQLALVWLEKLLCGKDLRHSRSYKKNIGAAQKVSSWASSVGQASRWPQAANRRGCADFEQPMTAARIDKARNPIGRLVAPFSRQIGQCFAQDARELEAMAGSPAANKTLSCCGCRSTMKCSSGDIV